MGIPIDTKMQATIDKNFSFLELLPIPTAIIHSKSDELICANTSLRELLKIDKDKKYNISDLIYWSDKSTYKQNKSSFFSFSKERNDKIIPFVTKLKSHNIDNDDFIIVSFYSIFGEYSVEKDGKEYEKMISLNPVFSTELIFDNYDQPLETFIEIINEIKFSISKEDFSKKINKEAADEHIRKYMFEKNTTVSKVRINDIKLIKDKFGQEEADDYIEEMRVFIKNAIRKTDVMIQVEEGNFLIIFPNCAKNVVENIMTTLVNRVRVFNDNKPEYNYSLSYGITVMDTIKTNDVNEVTSIISSKLDYEM